MRTPKKENGITEAMIKASLNELKRYRRLKMMSKNATNEALGTVQKSVSIR